MEILDTGGRPWTGGPSFSLRNRLYRAIWSLSWLLLARWTPPPLHAWRRALLRLFGARMAPTAVVYGSTRIWSPMNLECGPFARIGPHANIYSMAPITVGEHAVVSQGAHLCAGSHDYRDVGFQLVARPITVGARAWVAAEAFVGPGVTVGEGAVLGARACTFRDLAPWRVYSGNPAREIKERVMREPGAGDPAGSVGTLGDGSLR